MLCDSVDQIIEMMVLMMMIMMLIKMTPIKTMLTMRWSQEYERAVIFRLGRLLTGGARGPGAILCMFWIFLILNLLFCFFVMYHIIIQIAVGLQELAIYDNVWVLIFVIKGVFFIIRLSWRPDILTSSNHLIKSKRCVLHHPLRWRVWEDRHENCYLWDSSTRGGRWSFCWWWCWWQRWALIMLTMVMLLIWMLVLMIDNMKW